MNITGLFLAMAPPAGQSQQSPAFNFGWIAIMLAIFYFILIRPLIPACLASFFVRTSMRKAFPISADRP